MGRLTVDRWLDEQIAHDLMVKNTFLDVPELADGSEPPSAPPLSRCKTAPSGQAPWDLSDSESCSGSVAPTAVHSDEQEVGIASSEGSSPTLSSRVASELPSLDLTDWQLSVRRTFLECQCLEEANIRRTVSMPDLFDKPPENDMPTEQFWPDTPRAEDLSPDERFWPDVPEGMAGAGDFVSFCLPVAPAGYCFAEGGGADDDFGWPEEYGRAAIEEEQLAAASAVKGRRGRRGAAQLPFDLDPLQIIADANGAACGACEARVWALACRDSASSLAVQRALAILGRVLRDPVAGQRWRVQFDAEALVAQLRGRVLEAVQHPHANHVVKQLLDVMPSALVAFVAEELAGSATWASRHKFGCRIVLRLAQHSATEGWAGDSARAVISQVLDNAGDLCKDEFGKFVIEEIMERGLPEHRQLIATTLRSRLEHYARHEHASFLIQRALRGIDSDDTGIAMDMAKELSARRDVLQSLARNQFGRFVLRDLARWSPAYADRVRGLLAGEQEGSRRRI